MDLVREVIFLASAWSDRLAYEQAAQVGDTLRIVSREQAVASVVRRNPQTRFVQLGPEGGHMEGDAPDVGDSALHIPWAREMLVPTGVLSERDRRAGANR